MEVAVAQPGGPTRAEGGTGVGSTDLLRLLRQLQVKLAAGLPIEKALAALATETKSKRLRRACREMRAEVADGHSLTEVMAGQQGIFDASILRLVEEGEQNRSLKRALVAATEYLERRTALQGALQGAFAKPLSALLLVLLAVFVATVTLSYLVKDALPGAGGGHHAALDTADRAAVRVAEWVRALWPLVGLCGAVAFTATHVLPHVRRTRALLARLAMRLPLLGAAYRQTSLACFAWTIGILMRAGVRLDEAMQVAAATARDEAMRATITGAVHQIESGRPYLEVMAEAGLVRRRDVVAVQAAERRGQLGAAALSLAADYQREANDRVSRLRVVVQTSVVLSLGLAIASVVLTLYVPVFILR